MVSKSPFCPVLVLLFLLIRPVVSLGFASPSAGGQHFILMMVLMLENTFALSWVSTRPVKEYTPTVEAASNLCNDGPRYICAERPKSVGWTWSRQWDNEKWVQYLTFVLDSDLFPGSSLKLQNAQICTTT